jgi:hypothetical protein
MHRFLRHLIPGLDEHLTDDRLGSSLCDELSFTERWIARAHLAQCWQCKFRMQDIEEQRAPRILDRYRDAVYSEMPRLREEPELEFSRKLRISLEAEVPPKHKFLRLPKISLPELAPMNPALVVCMVFGFATILSFCFWWQQRAPRISENTLLVRAEKWDTASLGAATQGVVYQTVRITMTKQSKKQTIDRSIYRDIKGKRQPKRITLNATQEQVKSALTVAGLDWNEPLSASGYQNWHDHQHVREDHIARAGTHLLRLTTRVPDGVIAQQTLTVRDTDFHPVQRTVQLRNSATVEIAEVDFKILPWNAVDANVFEPLEMAMSNTAIVNQARVLPFSRMPEVLTDGQLDGAELAAKLVLNQLHADNGEQIEIHRREQEILIEGVVETDERKKVLQTQLRMVPHTTIAIQSEADLRNAPVSDRPTSIQVVSEPNVASPLELVLEKHGRSVSDVNVLARRLANAAFAISQESKAIVDLQTRFSADQQLTIVASATLSELVYSHRERLEAAVSSERALIAEAQITPVAPITADELGGASLIDLASRNLALAKELTQTTSPATRGGEQILAEMSHSVADLTLSSNNLFGKPQGASTLSGKK